MCFPEQKYYRKRHGSQYLTSIYCDLKPPPLVEDPERFKRSGESQQPPLKRANISHRDHRVAEKYFFFSFERDRKIPDAACMVPISMKHDLSCGNINFSHEVVLSDFPSQKSDKNNGTLCSLRA
jgi:hypothetical protein